jgi:hypothetical protein
MKSHLKVEIVMFSFDRAGANSLSIDLALAFIGGGYAA